MNTEITYKVQTCNGCPEVILLRNGHAKAIVSEFRDYKFQAETALDRANELAAKLNSDAAKLDPTKLKKMAQRLEDKKNWNGLNPHETVMLIAIKINYQELTGEVLKLKYNCPS